MSTHEMISGTKIGRKHILKHIENQDRILLREMEVAWSEDQLALIAVADGVSGCPFGGSVARWLIDRHLQCDGLFAVPKPSLAAQLQSYLSALYQQWLEEFADLPEMLESGSSLSIAVCFGDHADCLWVGDSPIFVSLPAEGGYTTRQVSQPDNTEDECVLTDCFGAGHRFDLKHENVDLPEGGIVTIGSDGITYDEGLLNEVYPRLGFSQDVVAEVIDVATAATFSDDCSLVACRRSSS